MRANRKAGLVPTARTTTTVVFAKDAPIAFPALLQVQAPFDFFLWVLNSMAGRHSPPSLAITDVMSDEPITPHDDVGPPLFDTVPLLGISWRTSAMRNAYGTALALLRGFLDEVAALLNRTEAAFLGTFNGGYR